MLTGKIRFQSRQPVFFRSKQLFPHSPIQIPKTFKLKPMKILPLFLIIFFIFNHPVSGQPEVPGIPSDKEQPPSQDRLKPRSDREEKRKKLKEQKKQVIGEILADIKKLENPDDRANFLAKAGKYLCQVKAKDRAEEVFEETINELLLVKKKERENSTYKTRYGPFFHIFVLQEISACDPELAYEYLLRIRSPRVKKILEDFYRNPNIYKGDEKTTALVGWELNLESNIKSKIIWRKPERTLELIEHDINTFITHKTLETLRRIPKGKAAEADRLAEKAVKKLLVTDFFDEDNKPTPSGLAPVYQTANRFLKYFGKTGNKRKYGPKISESLLIRLADKISSEQINSGNLAVYREELEIIRRYFPERFARIEQLKAEWLKTPEIIEAKSFEELKTGPTSAEILLSKAESFSDSYRQKIYTLAACRLVEEKRTAEAESFLQSKYPNEFYRSIKQSLIIYSHILDNLKYGDFQRAEYLIRQIPDPQLKTDALTVLAEKIFLKKQDSKKALMFLAEAGDLLEQNLHKIVYSEAMIDIISAYALVAPDEAFPMFDKLLNQTDYSNKLPVSFKGYNDYKDIGFIGYSGYKNGFTYAPIVARLKNASFEKTLAIINKNKSPKTRVHTKTHLFERADIYNDYHGLENYCNP